MEQPPTRGRRKPLPMRAWVGPMRRRLPLQPKLKAALTRPKQVKIPPQLLKRATAIPRKRKVTRQNSTAVKLNRAPKVIRQTPVSRARVFELTARPVAAARGFGVAV